MPNDVAINFDMFGTFVEYRIARDLDGGLIITIKGSWLNERNTKILKNIREPLWLASGRC